MNRKLATIGALALTVMFTGMATSLELTYVQAQPGKPNPSTGVGVGIFDLAWGCGIGHDIALNLSFGGVCFGSTEDEGWDNGNDMFLDDFGNPAGSTDLQHITDAATATMEIFDDSNALTPATYCQNLNPEFDNLCGGNLTGEPEAGAPPGSPCAIPHREGSTGCLLRSEPYVEFCDTVTIRKGLTGPTTPAGRIPGGVEPGTAGDGTWADLSIANWAIDFPVLIFVSAPANGNTVLGNVCGSDPIANNSWGTHGLISHT